MSSFYKRGPRNNRGFDFEKRDLKGRHKVEKDEKEREGLKKQATCINHATESMHHDLAQFFGKSSLSVPYMPTVRFSHF